jgi:hypothetical protein
VSLVPAPTLRLDGHVDSNSPAVWDRVAGHERLFVVTSAGGRPSVARGAELGRLGQPRPVELAPWPGGYVWLEAIVRGPNGTWYGYYHNEIPADDACPGSGKMVPRIGAARSRDQGATWENLGILLEAPADAVACETTNDYFVNGVGDFSVMLDASSRYLYFFLSQYGRPTTLQGIAVARMAWAERGAPVGKLMLWRATGWMPATRVGAADGGGSGVVFETGTPVFPTIDGWHDEGTTTDAFWGPSIHWNSYLQQYVILLNRARTTGFASEGIYVSFAPRLDDPRLWSAPRKILDGGGWYPQVIGTVPGVGTDKLAGQSPRFFIGGTSRHLIRFSWG